MKISENVMRNLFSLRSKIFVLLTLLTMLCIIGGILTLRFSKNVKIMAESAFFDDLASFEAAAELETAMIMQKGYVTYYSLDGDKEWLKKLDQYQVRFVNAYQKAEKKALTDITREILAQINTEYNIYIDIRKQAISLYDSGKKEEALTYHQQLRDQFNRLFNLSERYKIHHQKKIFEAVEQIVSYSSIINSAAATVLPLAALLSVLLAMVLYKHILEPIRRLNEMTFQNRDRTTDRSDDVRSLEHRVQSLIDDVGQSHSQLEISRKHLEQTEKLAMAGKLAAGVAHSIRNPLTSVKMRLFSIQKHMQLTQSQKEDFDVISEEIRHIDSILTNFLDFSRRPKLKTQFISPSKVVEQAIELLSYRFEAYGAVVTRRKSSDLPKTMADPEQLKEVLVNILVNACEARPSGCRISIGEETIHSSVYPILIKISDNGPGVPESVQANVFQPFFTTKEEGTGLGLSIAARIIEDHGGRIEVTSPEAGGACFTIRLPVRNS